MKKILSAALAVAIVASSAGVASAQSYGGRNDNRDDRRYEQRQDRQEARRDNRQERRADRREARQENRWERRAQRRYNAGRYQAPRGYYARSWRRGERLPSHYRSRAYVVDYRMYGLGAPPRGYHYVRVDNDVILTAVATGVIASVVFDLFN
ncbi:MAG TPA: RcnB family protein [Caulobacteraceae bacterium]|nr:RcnB family protein [Caulobacteraceae bacterium]